MDFFGRLLANALSKAVPAAIKETGRVLKEREIERENNSPVCGKCGTSVRSGDKFCKNCGSAEKTTKMLFEISPTQEGRDAYLRREELEKKEREGRLEAQIEREMLDDPDTIEEIKTLIFGTTICSQCAKTYSDERKFCSECAGQVRSYNRTEICKILRKRYPRVVRTEFDVELLLQKVSHAPSKPETPKYKTASHETLGCMTTLIFFPISLLIVCGVIALIAGMLGIR